ncbi:TPA: restriction endonuclease subunit S [Enterococcus faecalis]|nr:restriction endonuclease subunit S [Enterococcus faecalis]EJY9661228.1 restriction endonuclease subunit S [Enterococcus faecalis]MCD4875906.1 restriction endonuclease subunit S [Enterococcus faecalis]MCD4879118.1 restriction endonuclease subunit S [Enterococcus faecalis]MCD4918471.1 restriction endonuclease subunit S [Enterococcus faecalis]
MMDGDRGANYPHDTDFFKDGDTLFLDTGNVTKNGFKFDSVKYITNEKDEQLRAGKLEKNDFVLTSRGTLGNVGFYDEVVYNLHPKIRINSAMLILRNTDEQLSYSYLHTLLKGQLISDFMKKNQVGSAQPHITKSEFLKLNLNVPCNINEQNKIGNFFKSLDVTITLHQRKLDQLKELKKAYLQVMFPVKDERVPKLRFATFEGEWELCKLGAFLIVPPKVKVTIDSPSDLMTVKLNLGGVYSGASRDTLSLGSTVYYKRFSGQFIYGKQNFFNGSMAIIPKELHGKATSGDVPSFDIININKDYLFYFISRKSYWKSKEVEATGTGSKRIHEKTLQNFPIMVPLKEEQIKISTFCDQLDEIITLHQSKLNQLKTLKKSYLQNMFI